MVVKNGSTSAAGGKKETVETRDVKRKETTVKALVLSGMWRLHLYGQIPLGARIGPAQTPNR